MIPEIKLVRAENTQIKTTAAHSDLITRIDTTDDRLNRLDEVIGRPREHDDLVQRLTRLWSRKSRT